MAGRQGVTGNNKRKKRPQDRGQTMQRMIQAIAAMLACLLLTLGAAAAAPGQNPVPAWRELSPDQQQLLSPFKDEWNSLPADRRELLSNNSRKWLDLSPEEQSQVREQFKQWQQMPPEQQDRIRHSYDLYKGLPEDQRLQVQDSWRRFRKVTPEKPREIPPPQIRKPEKHQEMQAQPQNRPPETRAGDGKPASRQFAKAPA